MTTTVTKGVALDMSTFVTNFLVVVVIVSSSVITLILIMFIKNIPCVFTKASATIAFVDCRTVILFIILVVLQNAAVECFLIRSSRRNIIVVGCRSIFVRVEEI